MKDFGKLNFSVSFQPTSAFPIDGRTVFSSYASALAAAKTAEEVGSTNTRYHIGMKLLVAEEGVEPVWYTITKDKTLAAEGDGSVADHNASAEAHKALFDSINKKIDDNEVDIPDKLPNPNAITFTGAVNASYDGSTPVSVEIPKPGSVDIPTTLPNPKALTFTGAVSKTYDGSSAVSVAIPTVPSSLKNPNAITFTGAATGTYDGSAPLTVNIPEGGASITVDDAFNPESTNPVQNKVICAFVLEANETVTQIQKSIPSDNHINELINTALGVIENGTY